MTHIIIPRLERNRAGVELAFILNRKIKLSPKLLAVIANELFKYAAFITRIKVSCTRSNANIW